MATGFEGQSMSPATASERHDTHGKALSLNLDASIYGTLAEIGAGQEVARWFLSVGAASGTVAKTISAYDKKVSDEIYGAGTRYVSKERLLAMLDHEYRLLLERLGVTGGEEKRFFAFADTVSARNYQGTNEQHGWVGIRFQIEPGAPPSQVLLHINLSDPTAQLQQQAIGILGVNLVYAAYHQRTDVDMFLRDFSMTVHRPDRDRRYRVRRSGLYEPGRSCVVPGTIRPPDVSRDRLRSPWTRGRAVELAA